MRASLKGLHVSGAERIIPEEEIPPSLLELINRPTRYDSMVITLERIDRAEVIEKSLKISSYEFESLERARSFALQCLVDSGISRNIAKRGIELLARGAGPGGKNMRGAVLMDLEKGTRLEPDRERGIRTVRVDWVDRKRQAEFLPKTSLTQRSLDAIAIATKNIHCGVIAELCWSDDPDYTTGYVASQLLGYVRIHPLKEKGSPIGGRVYFIRKEERDKIIKCLQEKPVLIKELCF